MRGVWDFRKGQGGEHPVEGIASQEEEFRFGARGNRNPREDSEPKVDLN